MSVRNQRVGTGHSDRVREDVSLEYVTSVATNLYTIRSLNEAMSWVGWWKFLMFNLNNRKGIQVNHDLA